MERRNLDVVVISDVHLGTYGCHAKELVTYLRSIKPTMLVLNGDIIDGWQFTKSFFPDSHIAVIKEIMELMMRHQTKVYYITGNHDELLRKYSDLSLGLFTLTDKLVIEINKKMTWIFHGDVFDNTTKGSARFVAKLGSSGYALLILLNKLINCILQAMGKGKLSLSKKVMARVNKAVSKINDLKQIASEIAISKNYDYVICGHIHQPEVSEVETADGKVIYLNSGDWVEHLTSLEYANNEWKIYTYREKTQLAEVIKMNTQARVFTNEVNFVIN